jgi:thiosulfate/3-mercaptopyruvate sulfurtransferase
LVDLVDFSWIDQNKEDPGLVIADSRPPVKYLQGHIPRAVNLPTSRVFDRATLELLPIETLTRIVGDAGIDEDRTVLICDDYDGQNGAMLAWTLELLGHPKVKLLSTFISQWIKENRPISYRPTNHERRAMGAKLNNDIRASREEISRGNSLKLVDLRSRDEFEGKSSDGPQSRHLPGALSLPWTDVISEDAVFRGSSQLEKLVLELGLGRDNQIVTYCSYGPRAALGYAALRQLGFKNVKVYDKAFLEWTSPTVLSLEI